MKFLQHTAARWNISGGTRASSAFSLIEMLLVIAVIGIMGALILTAVTNATQDSRVVVARQQQAVLQNALNAWIAANSTGTNSLADAQAAYTAAGDKLSLLQNYLQVGTYEHFLENSTGDTIQTDAMKKAGLSVTFSAWSGAGYPAVELD